MAKRTQIGYFGSFWTQFRVSRDLFTDLTAGVSTVRTFLPRYLTVPSRIQNCSYRKIVTHRTPRRTCPINPMNAYVLTVDNMGAAGWKAHPCVKCTIWLIWLIDKNVPYRTVPTNNSTVMHINSLAPGNFEWNFRYVIFQGILVIDGWGISCEIALLWMSVDFIDDQSTLVRVMAWCRQAASHYLSQCWPRPLTPYGVTRPQWVNASRTGWHNQ